MDQIADRALYIKYDLIPLTREDKELTDKLRDHMVDNEVQMVTRPGGVIVLKTLTVRRFNLDKFKKDQPDLYEQYRDPNKCYQIWRYPNNKEQENIRNSPLPDLPVPPAFL